MARSSLSTDASNVLLAIVFPGDAARNLNSGGYEYQFRDTVAGGTTPKHPADFTPATAISVGATEIQCLGSPDQGRLYDDPPRTGAPMA